MSFFTLFRSPPRRHRVIAVRDLMAGGHLECMPDDTTAGAGAGAADARPVPADSADSTLGSGTGAGEARATHADAADRGGGRQVDATGLRDSGAPRGDEPGSGHSEGHSEGHSGGRGGKHPAVARVITALAGLLVFLALVGPDDFDHLTPAAFVRIPVEGLLAVPILLLLPGRARQVAAALAGVVLGLLAILKIVDIGFSATLDRPFDLVLDWGLLGDAVGVVTDSVGRVGAVGTVVAVALLAAAMPVLMTLSALRLTRLAVRRSTAAIRAAAVLGIGWVACAALGAQLVPGVPVAASADASLVYQRALQVRAGLHDGQAFGAQAAGDPFAAIPGNELLTGLRGKDVIVTFVESYGRDAVEDPRFAPQVNAVLGAGTQRLRAAGYSSRSAYLTSSTAGGGSWLAHATLFSGLWINNQQRHQNLISGDRLTLPRAFNRAGWRTVSVEPATHGPWPERTFYGYDKGYDRHSLPYRGPQFSYAPMPDQYTFAAFQRAERARRHAPVMAEITLVSSHTPWTPLPRLIDWKDVGDGSVFARPTARQGGPATSVLGSPTRLRTAYRQSIEYSLNTVISYVEKYGDDNLVLVFLGDHQPAPIITGPGATRDVPITIVARDPAVLNRIASWGWHDGLRPGPDAPVWPMDTFRNRFLTAFAR